jgi:hypothetical protein
MGPTVCCSPLVRRGLGWLLRRRRVRWSRERGDACRPLPQPITPPSARPGGHTVGRSRGHTPWCRRRPGGDASHRAPRGPTGPDARVHPAPAWGGHLEARLSPSHLRGAGLDGSRPPASPWPSPRWSLASVAWPRGWGCRVRDPRAARAWHMRAGRADGPRHRVLG